MTKEELKQKKMGRVLRAIENAEEVIESNELIKPFDKALIYYNRLLEAGLKLTLVKD